MNILSRNLIIFLIACVLGVGAIIVFARSNMADQNSNNPNSNLTQFTESSPTPTQNTQSLSSQNPNMDQAVSSGTQGQSVPQSDPNALPTGPITELMIKDIVVGSGPEVKSGDTVDVHYTGTFLDGRKFDSSLDRGQPFSFTVGAGSVIKGWDQGLVGMKTGGKRQLIIPSELAYGEVGAPGAIPPNTPLVFEIQLVAIK